MTTGNKIAVSILATGGLVVALYLSYFAGLASRALDIDERKMEMEMSDLLAISQGILLYEFDHGAWPASLAEMDKGPHGPYIEWGSRIPGIDIWNNPIQYEQPGSSNGLVVLRSLGKDGKPGGTWTAADIEIRFNHHFYQRAWSNYWPSRTIGQSREGEQANRARRGLF